MNDGPTILVIDDERDTLTLLRLAIQREGYRAVVAASWEETADKIQKVIEDEGDSIDVIVLDLMMPGRSGFDILRSLMVVLSPMPPVIMLSAVTGFEQQVEARELGVTRYLTKPTTPQKLLDAIHDVLNGSSG